MDFQVSFVTEKTVDEAVRALQTALAGRKFGVLWTLDVNETLQSKGFSIPFEVRILEVCNPSRAKEALEANSNVAFFLPCKVIVKNDGGRTLIGVTRPTALMGLLHDAQLAQAAKEVEEILVEAAQAAAE